MVVADHADVLLHDLFVVLVQQVAGFQTDRQIAANLQVDTGIQLAITVGPQRQTTGRLC